MKDVSVGLWDWMVVNRLFAGMIIKLVFAFLYQEQWYTPEMLTEPFWIWVGGHLVWLVNMVADIISDQS